GRRSPQRRDRRPLPGERARARDPLRRREAPRADALLADDRPRRVVRRREREVGAPGHVRARARRARPRRNPRAPRARGSRDRPLRRPRPKADRRHRRHALRRPRLGRRARALASRHAQRRRAARHVAPARAGDQGPIHADGERRGACRAGRGLRPGAGALSELARLGGVLGCGGLAVLLLATRRDLRLAGLVAWGLGLAALANSLAPSGHLPLLAAAGVAGLAAAAAGGAILHRWPYVLAFATLACV